MNRCALLAVAAFALSAPAGQASVIVTASNGKLVVEGDGAADAVSLGGVPAIGTLTVRLNAGPDVQFAGIRSIKVKLGPGDDTLNVHGLCIGGSLKAQMGEGDDAVIFDTSLDGGGLLSTFIGGDVQVGMGGQSGDFLRITSSDATTSIHIGGSLRIQTAADVDLKGVGSSHDLETGDITLGGDLAIDDPFSTKVDFDLNTVDLDNVNVGGATSIQVGDQEDSIEISNCHFAREVQVNLGEGNDSLSLHAGIFFNQFDHAVVASGQKGDDTVDDDPLNNYATPPVFKKFESVQ